MPGSRAPLAVAAVATVALLAAGLLVVAGQPPGPSPSSSPAVPPSPSRSGAAEVSPSAPPQSPSPTASALPETPPPPVDSETPEPCGTFDPRCSRMPIDGSGAVPFTPEVPCGSVGPCVLRTDVLYPRAAGPWPVVVAVPGGPGAPGIRSYLADFAQLVASQGAVVFVADYREGPEWGGGSTTTYEDIACAIRFARARASDYGGDGQRVTLVAHSLGPFFGTTAALSAESFEPRPGTCLAKEGSTKPDAYIGIAGVYSQAGVTTVFLDSFFGGTQAEAADAWSAGDPYAVIQDPAASRIPVRLIHGDFDANVLPQSSRDFDAALEAVSFDHALTVIPRADHGSVLQHRVTIRTVLETALGLQ